MKKAAADEQTRADKGSRSAGSLKSVREKASNERSRSKALARRLQKTSRIAALVSDISGVIEDMARSSEQTQVLLEDAGQTFSLTGLAAADLRHIIDLIDEHADDICGAVALITDSTETLSRVLTDSFHEYDGTMEEFAAVSDSNDHLRHLVDGFTATFTDMQAMDSNVAHVAELIEIAGLNASLDADTDDAPESVYAVLGSRIAGMADSFAAHHDRYAEKRQVFLDTWNSVRKSFGNIEDRIRALTVMSNGIKSMFDDLREDVTALMRMTQEVTEEAYQVFCHQQALFSGLDMLEKEAAQGTENLELLSTALELRDDQFGKVAGEADALAGIVDVMAEDRDFTDRLSDLYGVLEDFIDAIVHMDGNRDSVAELAPGFLSLTEKLEQSAEYAAEEMNSVQGRLGSIAERTEPLTADYRRIRDNLRETGKAFDGIINELSSLQDDFEACFSTLHELSLANADIGRFGLDFGHTASVCDCLGILCAAETAKSGGEGHACAGISGRLTEIVQALKEAVEKLYEVTDTVERHLYNIMSESSEASRDSLTASIVAIKNALGVIMDTDITPAIDNIPVIGTIARSHAKNMKKAYRTADEITGKAGTLTESAQEMSRLITVHRDVGLKARESAEKIQSVADELTGE